MKKLLSLSLLTGGFMGTAIAATAIPSYIGNVNTSSSRHILKSEKNETVAFIRLPEPGNPNRPSVAASEKGQAVAFIRLPEPGNPNRPTAVTSQTNQTVAFIRLPEPGNPNRPS